MRLYESLDASGCSETREAVLMADNRDDFGKETGRYRCGVDFFVLYTKQGDEYMALGVLGPSSSDKSARSGDIEDHKHRPPESTMDTGCDTLDSPQGRSRSYSTILRNGEATLAFTFPDDADRRALDRHEHLHSAAIASCLGRTSSSTHTSSVSRSVRSRRIGLLTANITLKATGAPGLALTQGWRSSDLGRDSQPDLRR